MPYKDPKKFNEWKRNYYDLNKLRLRAQQNACRRKSFELDPQKRINEYNRIVKYRKLNRDKINKYYRDKKKNNPEYLLQHSLRRRLNCAIKLGLKSGSAIDNLGCDIKFFKKYIETKFKYGMNWSNYGIGKTKWCLDHIIPISYFDLSNIEDLKKACNYTNLQPMWFIDNCKKSNKLQ